MERRGRRLPFAAAVRRCLPASRSTTFPMSDGQYRRRDSPLHLVFYGPAACVFGYVLSSSRCVAALAVLPAGAASAISTATLQAKLTREMRHAGGFSGAFVRDLDSQRPCSRSKPDAPRAPASVEKLYTTASALMRFGPDATLSTSVAGRGFLDPDGVWRGDLYLRGGGDPTLGRDDLQRLAGAVGEAGILRVDGSVLGDESRFDSLRGSFDTGGAYDRDIGGVLGALTLNRGFSKDGKPGRPGRAAVREGPARRRHPRRGRAAAPAARRPRPRSWPASPRRRCATSSG